MPPSVDASTGPPRPKSDRSIVIRHATEVRARLRLFNVARGGQAAHLRSYQAALQVDGHNDRRHRHPASFDGHASVSPYFNAFGSHVAITGNATSNASRTKSASRNGITPA